MQEFVNQINAWIQSLTREELMVYGAAGFAVLVLLVVLILLLRRKKAPLEPEVEAPAKPESSEQEPFEPAEKQAEQEPPQPISESEPATLEPQGEAAEQEVFPSETATTTAEATQAQSELGSVQPLPKAEEALSEPQVAEPAAVEEAEVIEFPRVEKPKEKPKPKTLKEGLAKTRKGFIARLFAAIVGRKKIEDDLLEEIEEILFTADIGARTAQDLLESIYEKADKNELEDAERIIALLKDEALRRLSIDAEPIDFSAHKPFVLMMVGVNGTGKTTTIGKLAWMLNQQGKRVLLAAADTFRAAAAEQLSVWAERSGAEFVRGEEGADPGSVVYNALNAAIARNVDVVIVDTAGRLHTKYNLMEELKKVVRVAKKVIPDAPHETWLVLDANTGQNAINQAREFSQAVNITGIVLTKLDGTAKGGIIIGICDELKLPVRYIGIGEALEDLRPFEPKAFVDALFEEP